MEMNMDIYPFILLRPFIVKKQLPKQLFSLITYDLVLFAKMYNSINKTANKEIMTEYRKIVKKYSE